MKAEHRLVPAAVTAWATAAVLIGAPGTAASVAACGFAATLACASVAVVLARRSRRPGWWALAAVTLLAVSLVAAAVGAREDSRTPGPLISAADAGRPVRVQLTVVEKSVLDDPGGRSAWDRSTGADAQGMTAQRIRGTVTLIETGGKTYSAAVPALLFSTVAGSRPVPIGSVLAVSTVPRSTPAGDSAAVLLFSDRPAEIVEGPPWYLDWAARLRGGLIDRATALPGEGGDLLPGLSTGDTSAVDDQLDTAMKASSLSHLTAVSGANCAVVVAVLTALLSALRAPRGIRIAGALAGLALFVVLVTPEPSVVRASLMATAVLLALAAGRPAAGVPILSLVVLLVMLSDPWLSRSYGFVLSALATAGLLTLTRPLTRLFSPWLPRPVAVAVAIPLGAQLACQPVLILLDDSLAVLGVPANLLAAPAAPVATLLGLAACLLAPVSAPFADLLLWLGWIPATWIGAIAVTVASVPGNRWPWIPGALGAILLAVLTGILIAAVKTAASGRRAVARLCTVVLVVAGGAYGGTLLGQRIGPALSRPPNWSVAACDVGQGDAVLVRSGSAVALIDTGPEPEALRACLDSLSIGRLDVLVLTHFDLDHIGGVAAVTGRVSAVLTGAPENAEDERLLAGLAAAGAAVDTVVAGDTGTLGSSVWRALWPPPRAGAMWEGNAASVTLVVEPVQPGGIRSLFLGDLGERSQERILAGHALRGPVDLVKMAHHGSADQSSGLYAAASARIGLIPVGSDNDYGHPAPAALRMLTDAGTTPFRTDTCGLIVVGGSAAEPVVWTARPC